MRVNMVYKSIPQSGKGGLSGHFFGLMIEQRTCFCCHTPSSFPNLPMKLDHQELPHIIVGACMEVHRHLGPGLSLASYKECLAHELRMKEVLFARDHKVDICYKERWVDAVCRLDFLIEDQVILAIHNEPLKEEQKATLRNFLRLTGYEVGLLVNFNVVDLREGIKRIIVAKDAPALRYKVGK